jgi:nucleotide-binding universal stress UspA family protein
MYHKVMAGFDGSEPSRRALAKALQLAKQFSAEILVTFVQERLPSYSDDVSEVTEEREALQRHSLELKAEAEKLAKEAGVSAQLRIVTGNAPRLLCDVAKQEKVDLLVIGHSGRSGLWGGLLGGTADKVVDHAPCSVLVVRD